MVRSTLRALAAWSLVAAAGSVAAGAITEAEVAKQPWMAGPTVSMLTLSPDGTHVAGIGHMRSNTAAFIREIDGGNVRIVAKPEVDARYVFGQIPVSVHWVANDLLAVNYNNKQSVSLDLSGKQVAKLGEQFIRRMPETGLQGDFVLVYRDIEDREFDVVNARTGERRQYRLSLPGRPDAWAFDASGALRAVTMLEQGRWGSKLRYTNWYRANEQSEWQLLQEWPVTSNDRWVPLRVLTEADSLAVVSRHQRDTYAVFRYDVKTRQHVELMVGHEKEDILFVEGLGSTVEKVVTAGLRMKTHWFDPRWGAIQAGVDTALPGRHNILHGDKNGRVLVWSAGDVDPGRWLILDTRTAAMREIEVSVPAVKPDAMWPMESINYVARDGKTIPAYLTRPAGTTSEPAPTVVLIHGGPQVRDRWGWDGEVQMLASAGYVVFQPQFRGSSGFGRAFEEAGYRQWGRAMQDDITDGVKHLIERKITDSARVCIYGASYGGYAALWGTINTPQLYRCGISFAGVSDLSEQLSSTWRDDSTPASRAINQVRIGDPKLDSDMLDEVSPLKHADRVGAPLLIAHGEQDLRVLPSQSRDMVRALQAAGRPVEWMLFEDEGHGLFWKRSAVRFNAAVLRFLDRHIGDRPAMTAPDVAGQVAEAQRPNQRP
jgi:dienelactone hydrolase